MYLRLQHNQLFPTIKYNFVKLYKLLNQQIVLSCIVGIFIGCFCYYAIEKINLKRLNNADRLNENSFVEVNRTVADKLYKDVRILCWVMTCPANLIKAYSVQQTWGKRCNVLLLMSSKDDDLIGTIGLHVKEGRKYLWSKTKKAFQYIYDNHLNDADWFLKADDDTYVILENLRYMLYSYSPDDPIYFGHKMLLPKTKRTFMSGGAGYILSREAVKLFIEKGITNPNACRQSYAGAEDAEMGICLHNINVIAGDSRDSHGLGRFFAFLPEYHLMPINNNSWYWTYQYYKTNEGMDSLSKYTISFHYVKDYQMYVFENLIYKIQTYGILHNIEKLPIKVPFNIVIDNLLNDRLSITKAESNNYISDN